MDSSTLQQQLQSTREKLLEDEVTKLRQQVSQLQNVRKQKPRNYRQSLSPKRSLKKKGGITQEQADQDAFRPFSNQNTEGDETTVDVGDHHQAVGQGLMGPTLDNSEMNQTFGSNSNNNAAPITMTHDQFKKFQKLQKLLFYPGSKQKPMPQLPPVFHASTSCTPKQRTRRLANSNQNKSRGNGFYSTSRASKPSWIQKYGDSKIDQNTLLSSNNDASDDNTAAPTDAQSKNLKNPLSKGGLTSSQQDRINLPQAMSNSRFGGLTSSKQSQFPLNNKHPFAPVANRSAVTQCVSKRANAKFGQRTAHGAMVTQNQQKSGAGLSLPKLEMTKSLAEGTMPMGMAKVTDSSAQVSKIQIICVNEQENHQKQQQQQQQYSTQKDNLRYDSPSLHKYHKEEVVNQKDNVQDYLDANLNVLSSSKAFQNAVVNSQSQMSGGKSSSKMQQLSSVNNVNIVAESSSIMQKDGSKTNFSRLNQSQISIIKQSVTPHHASQVSNSRNPSPDKAIELNQSRSKRNMSQLTGSKKSQNNFSQKKSSQSRDVRDTSLSFTLCHVEIDEPSAVTDRMIKDFKSAQKNKKDGIETDKKTLESSQTSPNKNDNNPRFHFHEYRGKPSPTNRHKQCHAAVGNCKGDQFQKFKRIEIPVAGNKSRVLRDNMMKVRPLRDEIQFKKEEAERNKKAVPPHLVMDKLLNLADFGSPTSQDVQQQTERTRMSFNAQAGQTRERPRENDCQDMRFADPNFISSAQELAEFIRKAPQVQNWQIEDFHQTPLFQQIMLGLSDFEAFQKCLPEPVKEKLIYYGQDHGPENLSNDNVTCLKRALSKVANMTELNYLIMLTKKKELEIDELLQLFVKANVTLLVLHTQIGQIVQYENIIKQYINDLENQTRDFELNKLVKKLLTKCDSTQQNHTETIRGIFRNYKKFQATKTKLEDASIIVSEQLFKKEFHQRMADFITQQAQKLCEQVNRYLKQNQPKETPSPKPETNAKPWHYVPPTVSQVPPGQFLYDGKDLRERVREELEVVKKVFKDRIDVTLLNKEYKPEKPLLFV